MALKNLYIDREKAKRDMSQQDFLTWINDLITYRNSL